MIALSSQTAAAIALHAAEGSWVVFMQALPPTGGQGPIMIEGMRGTNLARRLMSIAQDNAFEVQLIGLLPTVIDPIAHANEIALEHVQMHDRWFEPTGDLIAFIQHAGQSSLQELLAVTHPGGLDQDQLVDIEGIAAVLDVSVPTVRRLIKAEQIPFLRFGRVYRFVPSEVIASLQRG